MFGTDENYDVIVNPDKGDFEIWRNREVVADEELTNPNMQISLTEAQKIDASYEVGEEVTDEVIFAKFGRRAILNLRQTLASKILELEKDSIYNKYIDKVGTIINAEVYQIWKKEMLLLDDEGNELLLPKTEQIPADFYRKGETARAVVARVDNKNNNPKIILSRTSPVFLQRLPTDFRQIEYIKFWYCLIRYSRYCFSVVIMWKSWIASSRRRPRRTPCSAIPA